MDVRLSSGMSEGLRVWRGLLRRPFYAVASIVMLALAIGANAAAFGVFYGIEMQPLPYRQAGQLVMISDQRPKVGLNDPFVAPRDYVHMLRWVPGIKAAGLWGYGGEAAGLVRGQKRAVSFARETPSWFGTLGIVPVLGRLPHAIAGQAGGPREAMISYKFWQTAYGGQRAALGASVLVGTQHARIVGVLPRRYKFLSASDIILPLRLPMAADAMENINYFMIARLHRGVTLRLLNNQINDQKAHILRDPGALSATHLSSKKLAAAPLRGAIISLSSLGTLPLVLQGMAVLLLVLAMANAVNLALVRQRGRLGEFALRRVLGASRIGVVRVLLLEQIPILAVTAVLAIMLAYPVLWAIKTVGIAENVAPFSIGFGLPSVLCSVVLSAFAGLLIVAAPARQVTARRAVQQAGQGMRATMGRAARLTQRGLGAVQVALAFMLLVGSLILGLSLYRALNQPLGFNPAHRLVASVLLPKGANDSQSVEALVDRLRQDPQFSAVGGLGYGGYPFSNDGNYTMVSRTGPHAALFHANFVNPELGFFRALGISLRAGRRFSRLDYQSGAKVIIVGAGFAKRLFGTDQVVGRSVNLDGLGLYRIIGVTNKVIWRVAPWHASPGSMYVPVRAFKFHGVTLNGVHIIVAYQGAFGTALSAVRAQITKAVPGALVLSVQSYSRKIFIHESFRTLAAAMAAGFAAIALVLAGLGVYAVNGLIARARLPEFGLRAMLGANHARLLREALRDALWLLSVGLAVGVAGALLLLRAMAPVLVDVDGIKLAVFCGSFALVVVLVLGAAWRPARMAARMSVRTLLDAG